MNKTHYCSIISFISFLLIIFESANVQATPCEYIEKCVVSTCKRVLSDKKCSINKLQSQLVNKLCPQTIHFKKHCNELEIQEANIVTVEEYAFQSSSYLTRISLYNNNITSIASETFKGLNKLGKLELGKNFLTSIDIKWFQGLPNLKELHLQENFIKHVPDELCQKSPQLVYIVLFVNELSDINYTEVHKYCQKLRFIYLHNNPLRCDFVDELKRNFFFKKIGSEGWISESGMKRIERKKYQNRTKLHCVTNIEETTQTSTTYDKVEDGTKLNNENPVQYIQSVE